MRLSKGITRRKTWRFSILILSLLIAGCSHTPEEEYSAHTKETTVPADAEIYWKWAEDRISGMLLENESIERIYTYKGYELFSDEWYDQISRLTDPYLYVFFCGWKDTTNTSSDNSPEQDLTFMNVEYPRRAGDFKNYFVFSV